MCGINAPVIRALKSCGWEVLAWDSQIPPDMDIRQSTVQEEIGRAAEKAQAVAWAMDCSTFTRAQDRHIAEHPDPPQPLRSDDSPQGLQDLPDKEKK